MRKVTWPHRMIAAVLLLALVLLLAGCEAVQPVENQAPALFPRVDVTFNEQGEPEIMGFSPRTISMLFGIDLSGLALPPEVIAQFVNAGIRHIELVLLPDGIYPFVNGQPLPYLTIFDPEALIQQAQLASLLNLDGTGVVSTLLENLPFGIGLPISLSFPVPEGAAEIPMRDMDVLPQVDIEAVRADIGDGFYVNTAIAVQPDGTLKIGAISQLQLQLLLQALGLPVDLTSPVVDPQTVGTLTANNIQHVQIETEPEGIYFYANGTKLPRITYDEARLRNALELFAALQPGGETPPWADVLISGLMSAQIELTSHFPLAEGAEAIPLSPFVQ